MLEARYAVVAIVLCLIMRIHCKMEGYIVNGEPAYIGEFPYASYLSISCHNEYWVCGGSIINQYIIITAAHCIHSCPNGEPVTKISISVGSTTKNKGQITQALAYVCHEHYGKDNFESNDIALIRTQDRLRFNMNTSRVAVMPNPPKATKGQVAGWGYTDEIQLILSPELMKLTQVLWDREKCENLYGFLHPNTFCASSEYDQNYIAGGDSGSALVIEGYVQIGIVSYKLPVLSKSVIIYTNVSVYFRWIRENSENMYCL